MALNIAPHIPQVVVNAAAPSTESLARSNAVKEVVPAPTKVDAAVPQKTREQEAKAEPTGSVIYERNFKSNSDVIPDDPLGERSEQGSQQNPEQNSQPNSDSEINEQNGNSPVGNSAPGVQETSDEDASSRQADARNANGEESEEEERQAREIERKEEQIREQELKEIQQLERRDTEVRNHELAHATVGGAYTGQPSYEFETGPNGKKYAVNGEVPIDVSKEQTPEATIKKMNTVRAAALAPAEPSVQDRKVAAEATKNIAEARVEMLQEASEEQKRVAEVIAKKYDASAYDPAPRNPNFSAVA